MTMVLGYSQRQDRVIRYEFLLGAEPQYWMYKFTFEHPVEPFHWHYIEEYNSGLRETYDFRYSLDRERFEGTVVSTPPR